MSHLSRLKNLGLPMLLGIFFAGCIVVALYIGGVFYVGRSLIFGPCIESVPHTVTSNTLPLPLKWGYTSPDRIISPPHAVDGIVFIKTIVEGCPPFSSNKKKLVAIDAASGEKLWESELTGVSYDIAPVIVQDVVVIPVNGNHSLRGINKKTGDTVWQIDLPKYSAPIWALANDEQSLYLGLGLEPPQVIALEPRTGATVWEQSEPFADRSALGIIVRDELLYVLLYKDIFVLNPATGAISQHIPAQLDTVLAQFSASTDTIFTVPPEAISAINLADGQRMWTFQPDCIKEKIKNEGSPLRTGRFFQFAPTPIGNGVYTTGGCLAIFGLDKDTGALRWQYDNGGASTISQVAGIEDVGYIIFSDWSIRAIALHSGKELGRLETTSDHQANWNTRTQGLTTWNNILYATFGDRNLYAFGN